MTGFGSGDGYQPVGADVPLMIHWVVPDCTSHAIPVSVSNGTGVFVFVFCPSISLLGESESESEGLLMGVGVIGTLMVM